MIPGNFLQVHPGSEARVPLFRDFFSTEPRSSAIVTCCRPSDRFLFSLLKRLDFLSLPERLESIRVAVEMSFGFHRL
jgi:hypothetical protein